MKIAGKLLLMILVASVSLFLLAATGLFGMARIERGLEELNTNAIPSIVLLDDAGRDFLRLRVRILNHLMSTDPQQERKLEADIETYSANVLKDLDRYEREMLADEQDKVLLAADRAALKAYFDLRDKGLNLSKNGMKAEAQQLFVDNAAIPVKATDTLLAHANYNVELAINSGKAAKDMYRQMSWIMFIVAAIAAAATIAAGYTIRKSVVESLSGLRGTLDRIASSLDFTQRAQIERNDEIGETVAAVNHLTETLQSSLRQIAEQTQQVSTAAASLRETATIVTDSASSQSASASDMAATVEQMTVSINHVADQAAEARQLSSESGLRAEDGERVIGLTVAEINEIAATVGKASVFVERLDQDSQRVSEVVAVIKEVADQTNLLALNAAIEAARAGEQGRGFAVVADEVRTLAERTAESTRTIAETISVMQVNARNTVQGMGEVGARVGAGVERAREASEAIAAIRDSSGRAVGRVGEISDAIREQGIASTSIAQQVERIAQMSEENHAAAVNTSDTAGELDGLARKMKEVVSQYRI